MPTKEDIDLSVIDTLSEIETECESADVKSRLTPYGVLSNRIFNCNNASGDEIKVSTRMKTMVLLRVAIFSEKEGPGTCPTPEVIKEKIFDLYLLPEPETEIKVAHG